MYRSFHSHQRGDPSMEVTLIGHRWHLSQILKERKMLIVEIRLEDRASKGVEVGT